MALPQCSSLLKCYARPSCPRAMTHPPGNMMYRSQADICSSYWHRNIINASACHQRSYEFNHVRRLVIKLRSCYQMKYALRHTLPIEVLRPAEGRNRCGTPVHMAWVLEHVKVCSCDKCGLWLCTSLCECEQSAGHQPLTLTRCQQTTHAILHDLSIQMRSWPDFSAGQGQSDGKSTVSML